ncbi:MAG: DNA-directed RNA polymerase subunit D [Acidilobaceae archaeon]
MPTSVSILSLDDRRIKLVARGFEVAYVNALRRLVLSDVPTIAVDVVYFYENSTDVYDEMIAHRLGLTVLRSEEALGKYGSPEECRDVEPPSEKCFVEIYLDYAVDRGSLTGSYVKASDLKISDPDVKPAYPETPITYVAPGQRLQLVAYARLGRGREHAKWSPASVSVLRFTPVITFDLEKAEKRCIECLKSCSEELYEELARLKKGSLELHHVANTSGLRYCAESECSGAVTLKYDRSTLELIVESTGALSPQRIVYEAIRALESRALALIEELRKLR